MKKKAIIPNVPSDSDGKWDINNLITYMNTAQTCTIIAGPCSIDEHNIKEVMALSQIEVTNMHGRNQQAIAGTRIVGLKSRTELMADPSNMGLDSLTLAANMEILAQGGSNRDFHIAPSVTIAEEVVKKTGMIIATEVMMPSLQLPSYEKRIPRGKLMPWNPAVNQLGWQIHEMAIFAKRNGWHVGIKNGKWVGDELSQADSHAYAGQTTMEKTWAGLKTYIGNTDGDIVLIHRGVDVHGKGSFRNYPVHTIALRTKLATGAKLYFDPSHIYGPKLRDEIVAATIAAMRMKAADGTFLYDGILIEVGTSKTDTQQHITLLELEHMAKQLATFRQLQAPDTNVQAEPVLRAQRYTNRTV